MPDEHILDELGAYALGALEPAEKEAADRHLAVCADCRAAAAEYRGLAADLREGQRLETPPAGTWEAIAAKLPRHAEPSAGSQPIALRADRRRLRVVVLGWAATAAALLIVAGWLAWDSTRSNPDPSVADLASAGDTSVIPLAGATTSGTGRFFVSADEGLGGLAVSGLPSSPTGMTYQVWYISKEQEWTPGGSVHVNAAGDGLAKLTLPEKLDDFAGVAICTEPPPGSAALWGEMVLSGPLYD